MSPFFLYLSIKLKEMKKIIIFTSIVVVFILSFKIITNDYVFNKVLRYCETSQYLYPISKNIVDIACKFRVSYKYDTVDGEVIPDKLLSKITASGTYILIDLSQPCNKRRLWIVQDNNIILNCRVGHGKKSGYLFSTQFSNEFGSNMSSLGEFITGNEYNNSKLGRCMIIHGLEPDINNNAFERGIRFHGSKFAEPDFYNNTGRIGRSLGCFITSYSDNDMIIDVAKNGCKVFVVG